MMIQIQDLCYCYPDKTEALTNLSCTFSSQKIAILGANGSGKSTLIQHLNALHIPQEGSVKIESEEVSKKTAIRIRERVGLVFDQPDHQLFAPTVFEDVAFGPRNKGYSEEKVNQVVCEALDLLGITTLKDRPPYNLSLGQKKKVAIAGVIAMEPELLLFDEPFSGLDPSALEEFLQLLNQLTIAGHTIILSTHDVDIAYEWADECLLIKEGKLLYQGTYQILEDEMKMKEAGLCVPRLYSLFQDSNFRPRSILDAKQLMNQYFAKKEFSK